MVTHEILRLRPASRDFAQDDVEIMKTLIIKLLHSLTRSVLKKYHPTIIAITGSVGKTATKEAVFAVLATKFRVRKNTGNYNTEIGLPLTVLGSLPPGRSPFKWLGVFGHGLKMVLSRQDYPEMLVLEMGADKPGDIGELLEVVEPKVGIITAIAPTHTEQFGSLAGVAKEKGKLFKAINKDGWIVVNQDDPEVVSLAENCKAQVVTYGLETETETTVRAAEISPSRSQDVSTGIVGVSFKLIINGTVTPVLLSGVVGSHQVYPALAAAGVAQIFGVHMVAVAEGLGRLTPMPGRMRVLPGIKRTVVIDDTYNASPLATLAALNAIVALRGDSRKFAVLGDMLELGPLSEEEHKKVGQAVAKHKFDVLITVGERSRDIARAAKESGMSEDYIFSFSNTDEAGRFIQNRLEPGDIVLIKGSRGMRMEKVVKEIMAEPERAVELLVH